MATELTVVGLKCNSFLYRILFAYFFKTKWFQIIFYLHTYLIGDHKLLIELYVEEKVQDERSKYVFLPFAA